MDYEIVLIIVGFQIMMKLYLVIKMIMDYQLRNGFLIQWKIMKKLKGFGTNE